MPGIFTISLDFELHWGGFEKWPLDEAKRTYFDNTRKLIPEMLLLFSDHRLHVSWATVGMLMHRDLNSLYTNFPDLKPLYVSEELSAYRYIDNIGIGNNEIEDPYHFAQSLVEQIIATTGQELATHTFAHYYCNEAGQDTHTFLADLEAAKRAAAPFGRQLTSLVFPRNQFNDRYLEVCNKAGIKIVRSNPVDWWWQIDSTQNESLWKRLNRGVDAYFPIGGKTSYALQSIQKQQGVYLMPASRLLRPYNPKELVLNQLKIKRIKSEMSLAAQNGEVYHLWWHPHNFGLHPKKNMAGLEEILQHFQQLNSKYGMESLNMGEIADRLTKN